MAKVSVVQMNSQDDLKKNLKVTVDYIKQASLAGSQLVLLPENFAFMGDEQSKSNIAEHQGSGVIQDAIAEAAVKFNIWVLAGTIPILNSMVNIDNNHKTKNSVNKNKFYAASMLYDNSGEMVCRYDKMHLCDITITSHGDIKVGSNESYCESRIIIPGSTPKVFKTPFATIGFSVCYDLRFPELFRVYSHIGADIVTTPSAFIYETGKAHWHVLNRARAIENQLFVLAANQEGRHPENRRTFGHSMIVDPWGTVIAEQQEQPGVITAELDLDAMHKLRANFPVINHRKL